MKRTSQLEPRPHFLQLNAFAAFSLLVGVVTERYEIVVISERDDSLAVLLGYGEEVLQDAHASLAQLSFHVVEDQVRVLLRHGTLLQQLNKRDM